MASSSASPPSCALMLSKPPRHSSFTSLSAFTSIKIRSPQAAGRARTTLSAVKAEFDLAFFERDLEGSDAPPTTPGFPEVEDKEEPQCPPGLRKYETMVVLRPDMSEDERLTFTQKYEELLVAGGGMYVEVFNRGVIPLAYSIKKKNKAGETNTYMDGIYLLFTYFTNPQSMTLLSDTLLADDDVVRSSSFKIRKRKLF
ncbi:30S ribosomal protein S6 alpha, chloroplastic-like [Salvia miltiorrhiza]|uniref:30S ribosomal protein S6 alpha, chloroplastic-like n=1 Tax=Salvia miltiorrhiza TaxID=226208 RepID=UPI0025AB8C45|nr:30S ribosomal protein S6 alpha, chloroplastic-like [Salvia miltiorrhiza]